MRSTICLFSSLTPSVKCQRSNINCDSQGSWARILAHVCLQSGCLPVCSISGDHFWSGEEENKEKRWQVLNADKSYCRHSEAPAACRTQHLRPGRARTHCTCQEPICSGGWKLVVFFFGESCNSTTLEIISKRQQFVPFKHVLIFLSNNGLFLTTVTFSQQKDNEDEVREIIRSNLHLQGKVKKKFLIK